MKTVKNVILFLGLLSLSVNALAQTKKNIVVVANRSIEHITLIKALKAADLVTTLKGRGPFTIFAPTNNAFSKLPYGTVDDLLMLENKSQLAGILTYHVIAGNLNANTVLAAIKKGGGKATLTTLAGGNLSASLVEGKVLLTDENGGMATVTASDLKAINGIIHVIDTVLMPK